MKLTAITNALCLAGIISAPYAFAAPAQSLEQNSAAVERIAVTGSRIKRTDSAGVGKVDSVSAEDFAQLGVIAIDQLLKYSPFTAGASAGAESNYLSSKEGYGTASVNLRGLGQNRTLVLVNGRRFVPGGSGANSVVDLNSIPVNMIERMETLLDGSSAVYGADAVAGVVNIITKRSFDGVKIDASYGMTQESDAKNTDINLVFGQEMLDIGFIVSANYIDRQQARSKDRDFSQCYIEEEDGEKFCSGSSYTSGGRGTAASGRYQFNQDPSGDGDSYQPWSFAKHAFDFQQYFNLSAPYDRFNISANGYADLSENLTLFTENTYVKRSSDTQASPASFRQDFAASYPHNPLGEDLNLRRRMDDLGARNWTQDVSLFRTVIGLEGVLANDWDWGVALNYGKSKSDEQFTNAIDLTYLAETVNQADCGPNASATQCVDWFGVNGASPEALDHIRVTVPTVGENKQISVSANLAGDLVDMANGTLAFAAGIEYLKNEGSYHKVYAGPGPIRSGGGGSGDPIDASLSSTEIFGELSIPLADNFDLNVAARYSDYSQFDGEFTYKIGADWRVSEQVRLRSTVSTAVRTPNIRDLYTTEEINYTNFVDPCDQWESSDNATLKANCLADVGAGFQQGESFVEIDYPGSTTLSPETANNFTLGVVFTPQVIAGLELTLDYYKIEIEDSIRNISPSAGLEQCYLSQDKSHSSCQNVFRDGFGGDVFFMTVPLVNAAQEDVSGLDIGVSYDFQAFDSEFSIDWDTAYLDTYDVRYQGSTTVSSFAGTISNGEGGSGSYTKWRSNLALAINKDNWGGSYHLSYIGSADSQFVAKGATAPSVPSVVYHNIEANVAVDENLVLRAGINNLTDKQPPYYTGAIDQNTDPFTYDLLGRRFFVKATYQF